MKERISIKESQEEAIAFLAIVAYHASAEEVSRLKECLKRLDKNIHYGIFVNDYKENDSIEELSEEAKVFIRNRSNLGYGRAVNMMHKSIRTNPRYLIIANTDVTWEQGTIEKAIKWIDINRDVSLAVPRIIGLNGETQNLCKRDPTILGMISRRFIPNLIKPIFLRKYDEWFCMMGKDYATVFEAEYLSGCFMIARADHFRRAGGFDESFFLYLEDADLTRRLRKLGRTVHLPIIEIKHAWGRGNHKSARLTLENIRSCYVYFRKWGWKIL